MRVSIITAVLNGVETIENCIKSVIRQSHENLEYIIIDGGSTDGTLDSIRVYDNKISLWISEIDEGIYYALNKGFALASGDVIGVLHADDCYQNSDVIKKVVDAFKIRNVDSCYGDLEYVDKYNMDKVIRYWRSSPFLLGKFKKGWMPPHPTFFAKKCIYDNYGYFNTGFKIAADYELMLRLLEKHKITSYYIPEALIKMRVGGISNSNLRNILQKSSEDYKALKMHGQSPAFISLLLKNLSKLPQFIPRLRRFHRAS